MDVGGLYEAHARRLLVFFARRTYDSQLAMDLVAETFARAYEHRDRHRGGSEAEAVGWLWGSPATCCTRRSVARGPDPSVTASWSL
jgi:RNA polymerase sigma-70 factor (ECF subfamily)